MFVQKQAVHGFTFETLDSWQFQNRGPLNNFPYNPLQYQNRGLTNIFQQFYVKKGGVYGICDLDFRTDTNVVESAKVRNSYDSCMKCISEKWFQA